MKFQAPIRIKHLNFSLVTCLRLLATVMLILWQLQSSKIYEVDHERGETLHLKLFSRSNPLLISKLYIAKKLTLQCQQHENFWLDESKD